MSNPTSDCTMAPIVNSEIKEVGSVTNTDNVNNASVNFVCIKDRREQKINPCETDHLRQASSNKLNNKLMLQVNSNFNNVCKSASDHKLKPGAH